jgi:tetratricopeptide (TPR) repeat protein
VIKSRTDYDRTKLLADAARARERGKPREALSHLERVLEVEPENVELHRQVAPLLADVGRTREAWESYRLAARLFRKQGYAQKAVDLYRDALVRLPDEPGPWIDIADMEAMRGNRSGAMETLREADRRFRGRRRRRQATRVKEALCRLEPHRPERRLELAELLAVTGRRDEAREIVRKLARTTHGPLLERVRRTELVHWPSPRSLYAWTKMHL